MLAACKEYYRAVDCYSEVLLKDPTNAMAGVSRAILQERIDQVWYIYRWAGGILAAVFLVWWLFRKQRPAPHNKRGQRNQYKAKSLKQHNPQIQKKVASKAKAGKGARKKDKRR